jgi:hypothetical protein
MQAMWERAKGLLHSLKIPKTLESLLFLYFSYYLFFLYVCFFVSLFRTESLLIISSETTGRIIMILYMMIAPGLPSCMHILTCWLWHPLRSYDQIRKFRKSSISPKLLNGFQSLIPLCVGLNVCYIFSC